MRVRMMVNIAIIASVLALGICQADADETYKYFTSEGLVLKHGLDNNYYLYRYDSGTGTVDWDHLVQQWNPAAGEFKKWTYAADNVTALNLRFYNYSTRRFFDYNPTANRMVADYQNTTSFQKGGSLPWLNYGYDIGSRSAGNGFSAGDNEGRLINEMNKFSGGVVRVFLFTDARDAIDPTTMTFYNQAKVFADMDALLEAAAITGTKVIPTLFDYNLGWNAAHADFIQDAAKRAQLMTLMGTFINHYRGDDRIQMWDVMNEPYYGTTVSGKPTTVTVSQMQAFMAGLIGIVHANDPGKAATIGFSNKERIKTYWSSFVDGGADDVDIVQIHYWAKHYGFSFDSLSYDLIADPNGYFGGKPVFYGEIDPSYYTSSPDAAARLNLIYRAGAIGGLFWQDDTYRITAQDMADIQNWYAGSRITYYDNAQNRMESKTYTVADVYGNLYYHHLDEPFYGTYGRLDQQVKAIADADGGAIAYSYTYHLNSIQVMTKSSYRTVDLTDAKSVVFTDRVRVYEYDAAGTLLTKGTYYANNGSTQESMTYLSGAGAGGFVYWHFLNENFVNSGSGRIDMKVRSAYDADGAIAYAYEYHNGSANVMRLFAYRSANYGNFAAPSVSGRVVIADYTSTGVLIAKRNFYQNANNRVAAVTYEVQDGMGAMYYHYLDEVWGAGPYGRADIRALATADAEGVMAYTFIYQGLAAIAYAVDAYEAINYTDAANPILTGLIARYSYSDIGALLSKSTFYGGTHREESMAIYGNPDLDGSVYYHYRDEDWNGTGKGRVDIQLLDGFDADGAMVYMYDYHSGSAIARTRTGYLSADASDPVRPVVVRKVRQYEYTTSGVLSATRNYYSDAVNRLESETFVAADQYGSIGYSFLNEDYNSTGRGRVQKQILALADGDGARGYTFEYFGNTNTIATKRVYRDQGCTDLVAEYGNYFSGRLHTKTLPTGALYEYDDTTLNRLIRETYADGETKHTYAYNGLTNVLSGKWDWNDNLQTWSQWHVFLRYYAYDDQGRLTSLDDRYQNSYTTYYPASGSVHTYIFAADDYMDTITYDESGLITRYDHGEDGTYKLFYDYSGGVATRVEEYDSAGNQIATYAYYGSGILESATRTAADQYGNVFSHWMNDAYNHLTYQVNSTFNSDSDGGLSYMYTYYSTNLTQVHFKFVYDDQFWGLGHTEFINEHLIATYVYDEAGGSTRIEGAFSSAYWSDSILRNGTYHSAYYDPGSYSSGYYVDGSYNSSGYYSGYYVAGSYNSGAYHSAYYEAGTYYVGGDVQEIDQRLAVQGRVQGYGQSAQGGFVLTAQMANQPAFEDLEPN